jgi:hypothetical protein
VILADAKTWLSRHDWMRQSAAASAILALGLLAFGISFLVFHVRLVSAKPQVVVPNVRPFVASSSKRYYAQSGDLGIEAEIEYARTSHRSTVVRQRHVYPDPAISETTSHINDFDKERQVFLEPLTKSVMTMSYPQREQLSLLHGSWEETCPKATDDNTKISDDGTVLLGYHVLHLVTRSTPDWTTERWMAPELECFSLRELNSRGGARNELVVTSLTEGEPPMELFQIPADYVERSPREFESLYRDVTGRPSPWGPTFTNRLDDQYQKRRIR